LSVSEEVMGVLVPRYEPGMSADLQEESLAGKLKIRRKRRGSCLGRRMRNQWNMNGCQVLDGAFCQGYFCREENGRKGGECM